MRLTPTQKRHPGWVRIRRGLLDHLPRMSDRATKLYLYLHLTCEWSGPARGSVNASFEDIAKGIGCSTKTVQRALEELEEELFVDNVHVSARAPVLSHVAAV